MIIFVARNETQAAALRPHLESPNCRIIVPATRAILGWTAETIIILPSVDLSMDGPDGMTLEGALRRRQAAFKNPKFIELRP